MFAGVSFAEDDLSNLSPDLYNQNSTSKHSYGNSQKDYLGELSSNPYDADSVSNPYGKYGSPYSSDSINNPYGAGNPYSPDSPNNPYGSGLNIFSDE